VIVWLESRRVGKATGSRECAPDDKLRVPTMHRTEQLMVGTAQTRLCPPYGLLFALAQLALEIPAAVGDRHNFHPRS
jgi:hypothetical protein